MKYVLILLLSFTLGVCISCGDDEENPVSSGDGAAPNDGTTKKFRIMYDCQPRIYCSNAGEANKLCISFGYERAVDINCVHECGGSGSSVGWIYDVWCYKP